MEKQEPDFEKVCRDFFHYVQKEYLSVGDIHHPTLIMLIATPDNEKEKMHQSELTAGHKDTYYAMLAAYFKYMCNDEEFLATVDWRGIEETANKILAEAERKIVNSK